MFKKIVLFTAMLSLAAGSAFAQQKADDKVVDVIRQLLDGVLTREQITTYGNKFTTLKARLDEVAKKNAAIGDKLCGGQSDFEKQKTCLAPFIQRENRFIDSFMNITRFEMVLIFAKASNSAQILDTVVAGIEAQIATETAELEKITTAKASDL